MKVTLAPPHILSVTFGREGILNRDDDADSLSWNQCRRYTITKLVALFVLLSSASSSALAPTLAARRADFGIESEREAQMIMSIYMLTYSIGPLVMSALSEMYD